jgi:hypothetical protein
MSRLTLILSDLYLPAEAEKAALPTTLDLPHLGWLLRFADTASRIEGWRGWLACELRARALADLPPAAVCALAADLPPSGAWLATPVHLEARLDHVRLVDRGLLRMLIEQRATCRDDFAQVFGPALALHDAGECGFILTGGPAGAVHTLDPARRLDADVGTSLPSGDASAGELRRLSTEIEMWLHSARANESRDRAKQRRVSALWLWGGGQPLIATRGPRRSELETVILRGSDPYLLALAELGPHSGFLAQTPVEPAPAIFTPFVNDAFVEFAPMSGPRPESLVTLETQWFAPARAALQRGDLESLTIVANDRVFTLRQRSGWKFWRRSLPWIESMGRASAMSYA